MYRKGKGKFLDILMQDTSGKYVAFFNNVSDGDWSDVETASSFVCQVYGLGTKTEDVNEARFLKLMHLSGSGKKVSMLLS